MTLKFFSRRGRSIFRLFPILGAAALAVGCAGLTPFPAQAQDSGPEESAPESAPQSAATPAAAPPPISTAAPIPETEIEARAAFLAAELFMAKDQYDEAVDVLQEFTNAGAGGPEAMTSLARAHMRNRQIDRAVEVLGETIKAYPTYIPAYQLRSRIHRLRGDIDQAVADLDAALAIEPNSPEMLQEISMLELRSLSRTKDLKGDPANADRIKKLVEVNQRLLEVHVGSDRIMPLLVLASVYTQTGETDKAIEAANEIVSLRPQDIRGQLSLAEAYEAARKPDDALKAYKQALLIEPENPSIRSKMAELISRTGSPGGLLAFYEDLAKSFPRVREIQHAYGDELVKAGDWAKAITLYSEALKLWPDDARTKSMLARAYLMSDRRKDAEPLLMDLMDDPAVSASEMLELAQSLRAARKLDAVIDILKRMAETQKDEADRQRTLLQIAGVQIEADKKPEAIATLESLAEKRPDFFLAVAMLGGLYSEAGRFEDAHNLYARVAPSMAKEDQNNLIQLEAELYRREGRPDKAMESLSQLLNGPGPVPPSLVQLALQILDSQKDYDKAHQIVDRFISQSSGEARVQGRRMKAYLLWRQGDNMGAAGLLEEVHKESPENYQVFSFLAEVYMDAKQYDKAESLIQSAADTFASEPFATELRMLQARAFKAQDKLDPAIQIIEDLMTRHPDEEQYYLIAGEFYHEANRIDDAERVLRKAIEINPNNSEAYNALGYFFAEANVKLDEALVLVNKALEMNPGAGHILDSLGWVQYQRGEIEAAIRALESAVEKMKDSPDPLVLEHLGDAYRKAGEMERAKHTYGEALKMKPDDSDLKEKLGSI